MNLSFDNHYSNNIERIHQGNDTYEYLLDDKVKYDGIYSLNIRSDTSSKNPAFFLKTIDSDSFRNEILTVKSMIKHDKADSLGEIRLFLTFIDKRNDVITYTESDNLIAENTAEDWKRYQIEGFVPKETVSIMFGGITQNVPNTWFDHFEIYSNKIRYNDYNLRTRELNIQEQAILEEFVYPIDPQDLTPSNDDLKVLKESLNNITIVGLGENTHGSSEIMRLKQKLINGILKSHPEFNTIALEAGSSEVYELSEHLKSNKNHEELNFASIMNMWVYNTEEFKELMISSKNVNSENVIIKGVDNQFFDNAIKVLKVQFENNGLERCHINNLIPILKKIEDRYYSTGVKIISKNERDSLNVLIKLIQQQIVSIKTPLQSEPAFEALNSVKQFLMNSPRTRDSLMAENILKIYRKSKSDGRKIIFSAHNEHLKRTGHSSGNILADSLNDEYLSIGFTFFDGVYTAGGENGITDYTAERGYPTTIEWYLHRLNYPALILDLRKIRSDTREELNWIKHYIGFRTIGASKKKNEFEYTTIVNDFDYLIYVNRSHPTEFLN